MTQHDGAAERWSTEDREAIAGRGIPAEEVDRQLELFCRGVPPVRLNRPCVAGDGIVRIGEGEYDALLSAFEEGRRTKRFVKFVPASGAASRMFRDWYRGLADGGFADGPAGLAFASDLRRYAFYPDLQAAAAANGQDLDSLLTAGDQAAVLKLILTAAGLDYGCLPKALLKFHAYPEGARTALEEHLVEAALYAQDARGVSRVHFTISPEHEAGVRTLLARATRELGARLGTAFEAAISMQDPATDTIAVDPQHRPFRDERGALVFRPGGHGSLLFNLNRIDADVIFLKNIDNIVPDRLKGETVLWKKLLAGCLLDLQRQIHAAAALLAGGEVAPDELERIRVFARARLNVGFPAGFGELPRSERQAFLFGRLNRPLRVCGMVKNEGEPGGGPFFVDEPDGRGQSSLQIVEEVQTDREDPQQRAVWEAATHFNPVDLVCGVRDHRGRKFDLTEFVDPAKVAISAKSEKGRELLALERPGLWNGSMARWNTVFVDVPLATFNPVKTVADLLRPQHLAEGG